MVSCCCVKTVCLNVAGSMRPRLELKENKMLCCCGCPSKLKLASTRTMFRQADRLMPINIYIVTWNVLSRPPLEDLKPLLGLDKCGKSNALPDIYVIGLQEVKAMPYSILMDSLFEAPWIKAIRSVLAPHSYVKIRVIRLQGLLLAVFIKRQHLPFVQDVETEYTRTGLGRVWGNKGAVTVRLNAFSCSICFVNSHLAAHDTELKRRVEDYNSIVDSQLFKYPETENILFHDYIFWLGDLNFRFNSKPIGAIMKAIREKDYQSLRGDDQLHQVRGRGEAFSELDEDEINFSPTYKFIPGTMQYDINRRPAWTDRILHKVNANVYENVTLECTTNSYECCEEYLQSDHKPVTGLFTIKVFSSLPDRYVEFGPITKWIVGKENRIVYYLKDGQQSTVWDWIGLYKADFTNIDDYIAYTWVSGRGIPFLLPPTASGQASEHVIESWQTTDLPSDIVIPESGEVSPVEGSAFSWGSAETVTPGFSSGASSGRTVRSPTRRGSTDWNMYSMSSMDETGLASRKDAQQRSRSRSRRRQRHCRRDGRPTQSHSPIRRLSEQVTSAVFKIANMFQGVAKTKYVVNFPEILSAIPGQYCLLYLSHGVDSIHGMSDTFEIVNSELN